MYFFIYAPGTSNGPMSSQKFEIWKMRLLSATAKLINFEIDSVWKSDATADLSPNNSVLMQ